MLHNRLAATYTALGALLVVGAILSAVRIPEDAHNEFGQLLQSRGGSLTHGPEYPEAYRRICAQRRMLQNAYVGIAGLMLLAFGLWGMLRAAERETATGSAPSCSKHESTPVKRPPSRRNVHRRKRPEGEKESGV